MLHNDLGHTLRGSLTTSDDYRAGNIVVQGPAAWSNRRQKEAHTECRQRDHITKDIAQQYLQIEAASIKVD